jgi:outer membrane protein assembly factor BamB
MRRLGLGLSLTIAAAALAAGGFTACSSTGGTGTGTGGNGSTSSGMSTTSGSTSTGTGGAPAGASVLTYHKNATRDGVYVDPAFTKQAAAGMHKDTGFNASISGPVYAQPLFVEAGVGGKDVVIVVTEKNNVYALDAATGAEVWHKNVGTPVPTAKMGCGNISPYGITGTPAIDLDTRTIFFVALIDQGTPSHQIFALSLDDGAVKPGWPIDVAAKVKAGTTGFLPQFQGQRGALLVLGDHVYVPFGGLYGDCGQYHGWLVQVMKADPTKISAWATKAQAGGVWGVSGAASDGTSVFIATGNTMGADQTGWAGGNAVFRFNSGLNFEGSDADHWAPTNWLDLDYADMDVGGTQPVLFDMPGSTPSKLAIVLGKDGNAYLLNRDALGGIGAPIAQAKVGADEIVNGAVTYQTAQGRYVAFKGPGQSCGGDLTAIKINPGSPPTIASAWCASQNGLGSPMVTTTDGTANVIVWGLGAEGDHKLRGFDGDTGQVIFDGGGNGDEIGDLTTQPMHRFVTAMAAKGRIYAAADDGIYAFKP